MNTRCPQCMMNGADCICQEALAGRVHPMPKLEAQRYRVLVTGSRSWNRARDIWIALDVVARTNPSMALVHGDCPSGADAIADRWAEVRHIPRERHPAQWNVYGKRAGFFRNQAMVNTIPDLCLAFIREGSSGATQCAMAARRAAIPLLIIPWEDRW